MYKCFFGKTKLFCFFVSTNVLYMKHLNFQNSVTSSNPLCREVKGIVFNANIKKNGNESTKR